VWHQFFVLEKDSVAIPNTPVSSRRAQLFTVRLWLEDLGDGRSEWRGKVQHVLSGEACYFRDWATLIAALQEMLRPMRSEPTEKGG
jgi:hypothetical protein